MEQFFKRSPDEYKTDIAPISNCVKQLTSFTRRYGDMSESDAKALVKKVVRRKKPKDPLVTYVRRLPNGDRQTEACKLSEYFKDVLENGDIIAPSLTVYDNPERNKSLHANFLAGNIARRNKHKQAAFECWQNKDFDNHKYHDSLQKVMKIFNNSLSGAYASKSTVIYNPSAHYTLTSITRSVASIGNAVTESVVAGNKCLYSKEDAINYIVAITTGVDLRRVAAAVSQYGLIIPTADDVMRMIRYSTDRYWLDTEAMAAIRKYVDRLNDAERSAVMYVNDLHHMRLLNPDVVREFVGRLGERRTSGCSEPLKALKINLEGINNLVHHICLEDVKGKKIKYGELVEKDPELLMTLGSTADNIYRVLSKYKLLLKAFFLTDMLPINIASIKDSLRDVIVLSDTDSTCGSYDVWVEWYYGNKRFTPDAVALSAAVMTINTQVIDHNIKVFAKNMNIPAEDTDLLKMKNEFFWSAFAVANVSKHYYANVIIQEGNVYDKPKLELKGVHFIASAANQEVVGAAHAEIIKCLGMIEKGEKINSTELISKVIAAELSILEYLNSGKVEMFKLVKIKSSGAYKLDDKSKTPYFHHDLWMEVFADKYGDPGEPEYMCVCVPTVLKSRAKLAAYLDTIEDTTIRDRLANMLKKNGKDSLGTFRLPLAVVGGKGLPSEVHNAIDKHRIVLDNMHVFYLLVETLGIFRSPKLLFSEMYPNLR